MSLKNSFLGALAASGVVDFLGDLAGKGLEKGVEAVGERKKQTQEYRHELVAWWNHELKSADEVAAENLIRRHLAREQNKKRSYSTGGKKMEYEPGSEYYMIKTLGEVFKNLDPMKEAEENQARERQARLEFFKMMGHMSDKEFDSFLTAIHDDTVQQWVLKVWRAASFFGKEAYKTAEKALISIIGKFKDSHDWLEVNLPEPDEVGSFVRNLDAATANSIGRFNSWANNWLDSKGVSR